MALTVRIDMSRLRIQEVKRRVQQELTKEIRTTGLEVVSDAKMKLTTDGHVKSGRLRASIHMEYRGNRNYYYKDNSGTYYWGSLKEPLPNNNLAILIGSNVVYANHIERIDSYIVWAFEKSKPGLNTRLRNIMSSL